MLQRSVIILASLAVLVTCVACAERRQNIQHLNQAKVIADKYFATVSEPGPEADSVFGLSDAAVFGRHFLLSESAARKDGDSWERFRVTVRFWIRGVDATGKTTRRRRQMDILVAVTENESLEVVGVESQVDKPLTFVRQVLTWLLWSFLGPIVLAGFLVGISERLALWAWMLSALPLQIYAAFVCFGTVLAVVLCTVFYLLLGRQLYKMMMKA